MVKPHGVDVLLPPAPSAPSIDAQQAWSSYPKGIAPFVDDLGWFAMASLRSTGKGSSSAGGLHISPKGYQPLLDVPSPTTLADRQRARAAATGSRGVRPQP